VIGSAAAKVPALSQIAFAKSFDKCTSSMLQAYFEKKVISTVVIEQSKPGPSATLIPLAEVTLTNAYIASYGIVGNTTTEATETWTLSFDKICVTTYGQLPDGAPGPGTTVCYYSGDREAQQRGAPGIPALGGIRAIQEAL
jgi:type VI protein secretion system component Hcp